MSETAAHLLTQLEELQAAYLSDEGLETDRGKGFLRLFRHWVSYNPQSISPRDAAFLKESERLTTALAEALAEAPPPAGKEIASRAVRLLLNPPAVETHRDRAWYLLAAGYPSGQLFPYLSQSELRLVRDDMLARTPRRMMYPKQLELLDRAEALLDGD